MRLSQNFFDPSYDDAPWLADQLLLPNLARGNSIHVLSAFAPSYLFKLVEDLSKTEEVEPGFLNLVFFVPGDLSLRSQSIARFKKYLLKYSNEWELCKFVENSLKLMKEGRENGVGGLQISVQHTTQKKPLTRSLAGVIVDPEYPEEYVTFLDAKGGDFNSPVQISRSWDEDEQFHAQEILGIVSNSVNNKNPRASLVSPLEVEDWLIYLANFYEENPPEDSGYALGDTVPKSEPAPESSILEIEDEDEDDSDFDEFLEHLKNLGDFDDEEQYGWFGSDEDSFDLGPVTLEVSSSNALHGHIPPLEPFAAQMVGGETAVSRCICGQKFIRAYGCEQVVWDRWMLEDSGEEAQ